MRKYLAILSAAAAILITSGNSLLAATFPTLPNLKARWLASAGSLEQDNSTAEDGDFVYTWQDQSGNGNHAIGSGGNFFNPKLVQSNADFNNQPTLRFTGLHALQTLDAPNLNITGKNLTVFAVLKLATSSGEQGFLANYFQGNGFYLGKRPNGDDDFIFFHGNDPAPPGPTNGVDNAFIEGGDASTAVARARILTAVVDATTASFLENRVDINTPIASHSLGDSGTGFQIGYSNGFNNYFVGDFAEILVYDRGLSASELHQVTSYLEETYGIPEPGSLSLVAVAGLYLLRRHRKSA